MQRGLGLADIQAAETAFDEGTARGDDFLVQTVVVAAQHDDAAMGDDHGMSQRRVVHHAGRDTGQVFGLGAQRPDFGTQQAQAHLHEAMIEVGEHHVVPAGGKGSVEDDGANVLGVGMGESIGALRPAAGEGGQAEHGAGLAHAGGVGPDALDFDRYQRRLTGQFQADADDIFDVFGSEVQLVLGFMQLGGECFQLTPQIALEFEHAPHRLGLLLGAGGVEAAAAAEHGFFDLAGNDGADLAEVFADGLYLESGTHQEFQIGLQVANLAGGAGSVETAADEMVDMHLVGLLAMAIHAAIALLHAVRVPGDLEVDQL